MQGWRKGMEDAHFAIANLGNDVALFGVFDGHGGEISYIKCRTTGSAFCKEKSPKSNKVISRI